MRKSALLLSRFLNSITLKVGLILIVLYWLTLSFHLPILQAPLGIVLVALWPGLLLNDLLGLNDRLRPISRLGFAVTSSIAVFSLLLIFGHSSITFTARSYQWLVLSLNVLVTLAHAYYIPDRSWRSFYRENRFALLAALIPVAYFTLNAFLSPYLVDQDAAGYITLMKLINTNHVDTTFLYPTRQVFSYVIFLFYYLTGLDFLTLFRFIVPGVIWLGLTSLAELIPKKQKSWLALTTGSIVLLASASFIGQLERLKPEILSFLFNGPALVLYLLAVTEEKPLFYGIGLAYSFLAFRTHETANFTLLGYLIGGGGLLALFWPQLKPKITVKSVGLVFLIVLPYLVLLNIPKMLAISATALNLFPNTGLDHHFRWWFVNHYVSGGVVVSWPGWTFIPYYLYVGGGVTVGAITLYLANHRKIWRNPRRLMAILVVTINVLIFLSLSEILPRFGYFFLPDRSWTHLFFYSVILLGSLVYLEVIKLENWRRTLVPLLLLYIGGAMVTATVIDVGAGSLVSRPEQGAINWLRQTPTNSIVLSTQPFNEQLVSLYGERTFIAINLTASELPRSNAIEPLRQLIIRKIDDRQIILNSANLPVVRTQLLQVITTFFNQGTAYTQKTNILSTKEQSTSANLNIPTNQAVYLLYSFTKTTGLLAKTHRDFWLRGIDLGDKNYFAALTADEQTHQTAAAILIRIR